MTIGDKVCLTEAGKCEVWMWSWDRNDFDECDRMVGTIADVIAGEYVVRLTLDGVPIMNTQPQGTFDVWRFEKDEIENVNESA
jgi:hypothetical protein